MSVVDNLVSSYLFCVAVGRKAMSEHAPLDACPASTCKRMPYHRNGTLKERMITDGMCTVCSESHCTAGRAVGAAVPSRAWQLPTKPLRARFKPTRRVTLSNASSAGPAYPHNIDTPWEMLSPVGRCFAMPVVPDDHMFPCTH